MRFIFSGRLHSGSSITFFSNRSFSIAATSESGKRVRLFLQLPQGVFVPIIGATRLTSFYLTCLFLEEILMGANEVLMGVVLTTKASLAGFFPVLSIFEANTLSFLKSVIGSFFPWLAILSSISWERVASFSNVLSFMPWRM